MAGKQQVKKASTDELLAELEKYAGLRIVVPHKIERICELYQELSARQMDKKQVERFKKAELEVYDVLTIEPRTLEKLYADRGTVNAFRLNQALTYTSKGVKINDMEKALALMEECTRNPTAYLYTARTLVNELGVLKSQMNQKQIERYERAHERIENALTPAQMIFVFQSYPKPVIIPLPKRQVILAKNVTEAIEELKEATKALKGTKDKEEIAGWIATIKRIREDRERRAEQSKEKESYKKALRELSLRVLAETTPSYKRLIVVSSSGMQQALEPEAPYKPGVLPDEFGPVTPVQLPDMPIITKIPAYFNSIGGPTTANDIAKSLAAMGYYKFMGDSGGMSSEGAGLKAIFGTLSQAEKNLFFGTNDQKMQEKILGYLYRGDIFGAFNEFYKNSKEGDRIQHSPFARFMLEEMKPQIEKMRILIPSFCFVAQGEYRLLINNKLSFDFFAFVQYMASGAFKPSMSRSASDNSYILSLNYAGMEQRVIPGGGVRMNVPSPLRWGKRPRKMEYMFVEVSVSPVAGASDFYNGVATNMKWGITDNSGEWNVKGKTPLYYHVSVEGSVQASSGKAKGGNVKLNGMFGFGVGTIYGKPAAVIFGLSGTTYESGSTPALEKLAGTFGVSIPLSPTSNLFVGLEAGGRWESGAPFYPKWLVGATVKYKKEFDRWWLRSLEVGGKAKFGELETPKGIDFDSPTGLFYPFGMLYMRTRWGSL